MAIKKKETKATIASCPEVLDNLLTRAFTHQVVSKIYEEDFKETKEKVYKYFETNTDGQTIEIGKAFKHSLGNIVIKELSSYEVDTDVILDLIKKGEISLEWYISNSKPKFSELEKALSAKSYASCVSEKKSESMAFTATPDFKAEVAEKFSLGEKVEVAKEVEVAKVEEVKAEVKTLQELLNVDEEIEKILK